GYDEEAFTLAMQRVAAESEAKDSNRRVLLHSGVVYPQWRNPRMPFRALRRLTDDNPSSVKDLVLRFRAPVNVDFLTKLAEEEGVMEFMDIAPELDYIGALAEMIQADGLLVLQNAECNDQVPAKLYEYFRAGQPILALTAMDGDTATAVREHPGNYLADLESDASIMIALRDWLQTTKSGMPYRQVDESVARCSRRGRTQQLAAVLNSVIQ
ncbi:MAG TPA: glycosyltransferase, partial [Azonexus sp.]|nr:glycosyltransferase [Azonexus sp.]